MLSVAVLNFFFKTGAHRFEGGTLNWRGPGIPAALCFCMHTISLWHAPTVGGAPSPANKTHVHIAKMGREHCIPPDACQIHLNSR